MKNWKQIVVSPETTVLKTMEVIDQSTLQFSVVVDYQNKLLGTVTDGDIRRGILNGLSVHEPIHKVMNSQPIYADLKEYKKFKKDLLFIKGVQQLPIVDENKQIQFILFATKTEKVEFKDNIVVLMAGGLGTRLRPLTNQIPKPLLKVGDKPILETIILGFKQHGFKNFIISVNYKKEMIKNYFQDGAHLGVSISYLDETERLGTAGALSLLKEKPNKSFFVMNGDLLTKINYEQLLKFHEDTGTLATMCVREYEYQIPYGVIETNNHRLLSIEEKPIRRCFVNAGIYVLNSEILTLIPQNTFYDMTELFEHLTKKTNNVSVFPIREYWMDIGHLDDYEKANEDFRMW